MSIHIANYLFYFKHNLRMWAESSEASKFLNIYLKLAQNTYREFKLFATYIRDIWSPTWSFVYAQARAAGSDLTILLMKDSTETSWASPGV